VAETSTRDAAASSEEAVETWVVTRRGRRGRSTLLTRQDRLFLALIVGVPLAFDLALIWGPTLASVAFSFTNWNGIGAITADNLVGLKNYVFLFTQYIFFRPALLHNILWLAFLTLVATPLGMFFAVLLDREIRGSRIYQSIFYLPVVLPLVVVGFLWELQYGAADGFVNNAFGLVKSNHIIDWLGDSRMKLLAPVVAASWRHVGYVMFLYLAGLKSVDPSLREAAKVDGANERQIFFRVVFPMMAPINVIIAIITTIE